jgi:GT2 family glycosyltransferase
VSPETLRVAVVVANWNGGEDNLRCLSSILAQGLPGRDVFVVDNGSVDGSAERIAECLPEVRLLRNADNLGFAAASNRGAQAALREGADAVLFVNNDAELPEGVLAALVHAMGADPGLGIVGPRILYKYVQDRVWSAGGVLTWRQNLSTLLGHGEPDEPRWHATRKVDYIPGCVMLVRRDVFERVGYLDPEFFAYMEDIDYCLRARKAGYSVCVVGEVAALHDASRATGGGYNPRRKYMMGVNSVWFLRRHASPEQWLRFFLFDVATLPFLWVAATFRGKSRSVLGKALGIFDGLRGKRVTGEAIREGAGWLW